MAHELGIIGTGNMGGAIVRGSMTARVFKPSEVVVCDIDQAKLDELRPFGVDITLDPRMAAQARTILLAIKPQAFGELAKAIAPMREARIVISIMAGLSSRAIRTALGEGCRVVRVMPNVPCQIGSGMSAIALGDGARAGDEALAVSIFNALGRTAIVNESLMHAVTAVSGSGPAYVFLLAEAMEQAAIRLGIDWPTARLLVEQTVMGAGKLLAESGKEAPALRRSVTSPGGTTAAALDVLERKQFLDVVVEALSAARDRSMQLDQR